MNSLRHHALLAIAIAIALRAAAQTNALPNTVATGAKLERLAHEFTFTEGPTCDAGGNVFFTDQPNDRILQWSTTGKLTVFKRPAGRANGMCFAPDGNLIACADETTALWTISPGGNATLLVDRYEGKPLNGPNDVWVRPDGGMYITDPFYKRPWWNYEERPQDGEHVYFLSANHKTFKRVITDLVKPNGIIGTPDGRTLFVADIRGGKTFGYDIQPDGSLTNKRVACESGSDGMTIDAEGNLYLTGRFGVLVFDTAGKQLGRIEVPERQAANVCFGGKDRQTLFITATEGFYSIRMRVKGANAAK